MKYRIEFRYISSYDYFTPVMYIPVESTIVEATSQDDAVRALRDQFEYVNFENVRILKIEEMVLR